MATKDERYNASEKGLACKARYRARHKAELSADQITRRINRPERRLLAIAKCRAKRQGIPFDITVEDIIIPEYCPILGIKLEQGHGNGYHREGNIPSLDKIIPAKGYVKGNVWVISWRANKLKNDATVEELELLVSALRRRTNASV